MSDQWNPYYIAYAKAHGMNPEEMMLHDKEEHTGGVMTGFILWMSKKRDEFHALRPDCFFDSTSYAPITNHKAWSNFLEDSADE